MNVPHAKSGGAARSWHTETAAIGRIAANPSGHYPHASIYMATISGSTRAGDLLARGGTRTRLPYPLCSYLPFVLNSEWNAFQRVPGRLSPPTLPRADALVHA